MQIIRCVISGSYRRDFAALEQDYRELVVSGCQVVSPHRLDFIDKRDEFVKDVAELKMSVAEIERHHLLALEQSDFVWLHCPNGYLGVSAALEMGYAAAKGIPIFSKQRPNEAVFQAFVTVVPSVFMAIERLNKTGGG